MIADAPAFVHPDAVIGAGTIIGHGVYIGPKVTLGERCVIQSGAIIGHDGFGYTQQPDGTWEHRPHDGGVTISDDVHIGANTCIDQGTVAPTVIGAGTRIDNLCHIAHNAKIGKNCMIVAGAEISGSVTVEDGAWIGPKAAIHQHRTIGARALVGIGAVVLCNIPARQTWAGNPARCLNATDRRP
jgi:UDP-3-O-[3-hydroxymyristoyl] glucosamine N-acyltransferase